MKILSRLVERATTATGTTTTSSSSSLSSSSHGNNDTAEREAAAALEAEARLPLRSTAIQEEMEEDSYDEHDEAANGGDGWYAKMMIMTAGSDTVKTLKTLATDTSVFQSFYDVEKTEATACSSQQSCSPSRSVASSSNQSVASAASTEASILPPLLTLEGNNDSSNKSSFPTCSNNVAEIDVQKLKQQLLPAIVSPEASTTAPARSSSEPSARKTNVVSHTPSTRCPSPRCSVLIKDEEDAESGTSTSYLQLGFDDEDNDKMDTSDDDIAPPMTPSTRDESTFTVETLEDEGLPSFLKSPSAAAAAAGRDQVLYSTPKSMLLDCRNNESSTSDDSMEEDERLAALVFSSPSFQPAKSTSSVTPCKEELQFEEEKSDKATHAYCQTPLKEERFEEEKSDKATAVVPLSPLAQQQQITESSAQPAVAVAPPDGSVERKDDENDRALAQEVATLTTNMNWLNALSASSSNSNSSILHVHHDVDDESGEDEEESHDTSGEASVPPPPSPPAKQSTMGSAPAAVIPAVLPLAEQSPTIDLLNALSASYSNNNNNSSILHVHEETSLVEDDYDYGLKAKLMANSEDQGPTSDINMTDELYASLDSSTATVHADNHDAGKNYDEAVVGDHSFLSFVSMATTTGPHDQENSSTSAAAEPVTLSVGQQMKLQQQQRSLSSSSCPSPPRARPSSAGESTETLQNMRLAQEDHLNCQAIESQPSVDAEKEHRMSSDDQVPTVETSRDEEENPVDSTAHEPSENTVVPVDLEPSSTQLDKLQEMAATLDNWMGSRLNDTSLDSRPALCPQRERAQSFSSPRTKKEQSQPAEHSLSSFSCPSSPHQDKALSPGRLQGMAAELDLWLGSGLDSISLHASMSFQGAEAAELLSPARSDSEQKPCPSSPPRSAKRVSFATSPSVSMPQEETDESVTPLDRLQQQQEMAKALDTWIGSVVDDKPFDSSFLSSSRDTDDGAVSPPRLRKFALDSAAASNSLKISAAEPSVPSPQRSSNDSTTTSSTDSLKIVAVEPSAPSPQRPSNDAPQGERIVCNSAPVSLHQQSSQKSPLTLHEMALNSSITSASPRKEARDPSLNPVVISSLNTSTEQPGQSGDRNTASALKIVGLDTSTEDAEPLSSQSQSLSLSLASPSGVLTTVSEESDESGSESRDTSFSNSLMEHDSSFNADTSREHVVQPGNSQPAPPSPNQSRNNSSACSNDESSNHSKKVSAGLVTPEKDVSRELLFTSFDADDSAKFDNPEEYEEKIGAFETRSWNSASGGIEPVTNNEPNEPASKAPISRFKSQVESLAIDMAAIDWTNLKFTGKADKEQNGGANYQVVELDDVSSLGESISASPTKHLIPAMMVRQHHIETEAGSIKWIPHPCGPNGKVEATETTHASESSPEIGSRTLKAKPAPSQDLSLISGSTSGSQKEHCGCVRRSPPHIKIAVGGALLLMIAAGFLLGVAVKEGNGLRGTDATDMSVSEVLDQNSYSGPSIEMWVQSPSAAPTLEQSDALQQQDEVEETETAAEVPGSWLEESIPAQEAPPVISPLEIEAPSVAPSSVPVAVPQPTPAIAEDEERKELPWFAMEASPTNMPTFPPVRRQNVRPRGKMMKGQHGYSRKGMRGTLNNDYLL